MHPDGLLVVERVGDDFTRRLVGDLADQDHVRQRDECNADAECRQPAQGVNSRPAPRGPGEENHPSHREADEESLGPHEIAQAGGHTTTQKAADPRPPCRTDPQQDRHGHGEQIHSFGEAIARHARRDRQHLEEQRPGKADVPPEGDAADHVERDDEEDCGKRVAELGREEATGRPAGSIQGFSALEVNQITMGWPGGCWASRMTSIRWRGLSEVFPAFGEGEVVGDPGEADAVAGGKRRGGNQPAVDRDGHRQENADPPVVLDEERSPGRHRFEPSADLCRHDPLSRPMSGPAFA